MPSSKVWVELTAGNLRNNHIYLRNVLDFFPSDAIGGSNRASASKKTITVQFVPGDLIETDIDGDKLFLRERGAVGNFFSLSGARAGDVVTISKIADRAFKFELTKK